MKNRLLTLAGILALVAVIGKFYAPPLLAQVVRAALMKNVDEPGRVPYQALQTSYSDLGAIDYAYFPPVPGGKRLVITYVSGEAFFSTPSGATASVYSIPSAPLLCCNAPAGPFAAVTYVAKSSTTGTFAGPMQYYVEELQIPVIRFVTAFAGDNGSQFTIVGYLIDKTI